MPDIIDKVGDMAKGLDNPSLGGILASPIVAKIWFFIKVASMMAIVLGAIAFIYKFWLQYKVRVTIHKKVGVHGSEVVYDIAKEITDTQNKRKLQMLKLRKPNKQPVACPIPEAIFKGKKGKYDHYEFWMDDNHELHPINHPIIEDNFDRLKVRPQERSAWGRMEDQVLEKKFKQKDKLLQYATPAILMTACITAFLIFFFASKEIGAGMANLASSFQQVAASCTRL